MVPNPVHTSCTPTLYSLDFDDYESDTCRLPGRDKYRYAEKRAKPEPMSEDEMKAIRECAIEVEKKIKGRDIIFFVGNSGS